jgi:deazaflavin-dependent oxidoreductase (nitroreductase family)
MGPLRLLETTGRISGRSRTTPVVLTTHQGENWLVSPFDDTDWVRNVRTQPNVHLVRLRRRQPVHLTEVDPETAAPVLRTFLGRFRLVPFVPPAFTTAAGGDLPAFLAEAHRHPVFHVSTAPARVA